MNLKYNTDLSGMNTFRMKVKAACLLEYDSAEELSGLLSDARFSSELPLPLYHIGGGSNLLFTGDFPGTILHSRIRFIEPVEDGNDVHVRVGSGVIWDEFCDWAASKGYWGAENLSLIPGEAGAAAVQNIGAYGKEVGDIIESVECLDIHDNRMVTVSAADCGYGYRESRFKNDLKGRYIVTAVNVRLTKKYSPELDYGHVREALVQRYGSEVVEQQKLTPAQVREVIIDIRRNKLPAPEETGSAGSFFRNPFVLPEQYAKVAKVAEKDNLGPVPHFPGDDGLIKIPAAWLIEKCGWKGYVEGNAGVYKNQPLVIINATGKATPEEILALESRIVASVQEKFGIMLRPEVEHI
ncbi:UDP-N-acetylmuramate dehydrogenase [Bacteroidales bacterium WCE2008]|nr:UDP-N-acetylmuramate dehydrogenase [Bacteroidales bacterium WCE2008]